MWLNLFATLIFMLPRRGNQFCSGLRQTGFNLFYSGVAYIVLSLKWEWYPASHSGFCVMRTNLSHDTDWRGVSTNANHFFFFAPSFPHFFAFTLLVLKMNKKRWLIIEDSISFLFFFEWIRTNIVSLPVVLQVVARQGSLFIQYQCLEGNHRQQKLTK